MVVGTALSASSDGRGDEPISTARQPGRGKAPHDYIYYRLYTNNGALITNNPLYSSDRFISCILSRSIAPPRTVASLKRHICRIEGFEPSGSDISYKLYSSLSEKVPLEHSTHLSRLRGDRGPGSSETDPMALMIEMSAVEKRSTAASTLDPKTLPEWSDEPRYVYYRVYDQDGDVASKTSFNKVDLSLGRLDTLSIPPPHNVSSLRSRLLQAEEASNQVVQIFEDDCGETIMNDADALPLSSADYPGIKEDEPIAVVYQGEKSASTSQPKISALPQPPPGFSKQIKLLPGCVDWKSPDPAWHDLTVGEIFQTDGVVRTQTLHMAPSVQERPCYMAKNSAGKQALVISGWMCFC